jgi:hypothetical protein
MALVAGAEIPARERDADILESGVAQQETDGLEAFAAPQALLCRRSGLNGCGNQWVIINDTAGFRLAEW